MSLSLGLAAVVCLGVINCSGGDTPHTADPSTGGTSAHTFEPPPGGAAGATVGAAGGDGTSNTGGSETSGSGGTTPRQGSETSAGGADTTTGGVISDAGASGTAGETGDTGPVLASLLVEGGRLAQQPGFAPERGRYSVIAEEDFNHLLVTATADSDLTITVSGLPAESGEPVELTDVEPGSEFEVRVTNAEGDSRAYTIVYLPANFPEFRVTIHESGASDWPIYLTPIADGSNYVVKLDNYGVPYFYLPDPGPGQTFDFKKHADGKHSYHTTSGNRRVLLDSDYEEVASLAPVGYRRPDKHEFRILPNGNYIFLIYNEAERDLSAFGGPVEGQARDCIVQEVTPSGDLVFEWNTWSSFLPEDSPTSWEATSDYARLNSVDFTDEYWIVSLRQTSQVLKVDPATGEVLWRLGGKASDFDFENDPLNGFCGQHTVSILENGHVLLFDNRLNSNTAPTCPAWADDINRSRVVEYALDEVQMTAELVWSYDQGDILASAMGSAQRLPNGNTLVGWGHSGNTMATEVDAGGKVVFELEAHLPDNDPPRSYRAMRFADD